MPLCTCGGQRVTCQSLLSPSTLWVWEIKLRLPDLAPEPSSHQPQTVSSREHMVKVPGHQQRLGCARLGVRQNL